MPLDLVTSIFNKFYDQDKIGHRIICQMELDNTKKKNINIQNIRDLFKKSFSLPEFCHFQKLIVNREWHDTPVNWENHIYELNKSEKIKNYINKMSSHIFPDGQPLWECVTLGNKYIVFVCDHTYGDGALVTKALSCIFDNNEINNCIKSKNKNNFKLSFFSRFYLFFKIILLIFFRFIKKKNTNSKKISELKNQIKTMELGIISLASLKKIREKFNCSDGSYITINDILHTLIVKTNSLYFERENISSAAMFNTRMGSMDLNRQNKLGYILLANIVRNSDKPEDTLRDVHAFMQFYKMTPAIPIITSIIDFLHWISGDLALRIIKYMNERVDFVISNYVLEYKDKTINGGINVKNINAMVTPCNTNQMYSLISYGDKINIRLTHYCMDKKRLRTCFKDALEWLSC